MPLPLRTLPAAALVCAGVLLSGCAGGTGPQPSPSTAAAERVPDGGKNAGGGRSAPEPRAQTLQAREIPGLGPRTRAAIPAGTRQALVVSGRGADANTSTAVLYERDAATGWSPASARWPAHNALRGWTDDHRQGDLRSPIGVYGLSDAGGLLPDPGTELPYDQESLFTISGRGFEGEPLEGSFDHVVAVDYNREPGTSPLDPARPLGDDKGGGIWIHVDHGGPTQGCVSLERDRMKELLRALDPGLRPVVVMGPAEVLAR